MEPAEKMMSKFVIAMLFGWSNVFFFHFFRPSMFSSICNVVFRRCANQNPEILHGVFLYIFSLIGGFQNLR